MDKDIFLFIQEFQTMSPVYDVGVTSSATEVFHCSNLRHTFQVINVKDIKNKSYRMPKWSNVEGEEEEVIENEWVCVTFLSSLALPGNLA